MKIMPRTAFATIVGGQVVVGSVIGRTRGLDRRDHVSGDKIGGIDRHAPVVAIEPRSGLSPHLGQSRKSPAT